MTTSIVLGMSRGELCWPYHPSLEKKVSKVYQRILEKGSLTFKSAYTAKETLTRLKEKGERMIEIFGSWEELCVESAVQDALELGLAVRIPKEFTFKYPDEIPFDLKQDIQTFSEKQGIKYRFAETENYMFFFPSK